jgi:hypothetical protein
MTTAVVLSRLAVIDANTRLFSVASADFRHASIPGGPGWMASALRVMSQSASTEKTFGGRCRAMLPQPMR